MVLTAIEFLLLAFFLGMITGGILEVLARPRLRPIVENFARSMSDAINPQNADYATVLTSDDLKKDFELLESTVDQFRYYVRPMMTGAAAARSAALVANVTMFIAHKVELGHRMPSEPGEIEVIWPEPKDL